ncbi:YitT family protein [Heliobacterium undosum]|uniref:YitT family protein n=1 Tax=Heliomicrobium undosum TaxID=121734 RepID=A0A845L1Q8_9FIRM|nr:YitT family protein [Heliomicrobium undosum]MZP29566.1 YitT family protein [Heliomicrobium undosum]
MKNLLHILLGCVVAGAGIILLKHAHLVTGGTPGLALSLSYLLGASFSVVYLSVNIPFYILSILRMGWSFTLKTLLATGILSSITMVDRLLPDFFVPDWAGALFGGILVGLGLAYLFINGSSLGGVNILVIYLHKQFGWDPGKSTFVIDTLIVLSGLYTVGLAKGFFSVLSVVILSFIISRAKGRIAMRRQQEMVAPSVSPPIS